VCNGESVSMQYKLVAFCYVLLSCAAGIWQGWCFAYSSNALIILVMGVPFALICYAYASLTTITSAAAERPHWSRMIILWAGMPLSLLMFALTALAETGIMNILGFGMVNLPFYNGRLLIAEAAASLVWAACLLLWSRTLRFRLSRNRFLLIFASLYGSVLLASGLTYLANRLLHKDLHVYLESSVVTAISAAIVIFLRSRQGSYLEPAK
jgi:hypothetical protein